MSELYNRIEELCARNGINITEMCKRSGASRASLTDLKMGRKQSLSAETLTKIAQYFSVSVDSLLGSEQKEKTPILSNKDERDINDEDLKAAFWGGDKDLSKEDLDEMWNDVRNFAEFVKAKKKKEKGK